jgi:hypothetical protein
MVNLSALVGVRVKSSRMVLIVEKPVETTTPRAEKHSVRQMGPVRGGIPNINHFSRVLFNNHESHTTHPCTSAFIRWWWLLLWRSCLRWWRGWSDFGDLPYRLFRRRFPHQKLARYRLPATEGCNFSRSSWLVVLV